MFFLLHLYHNICLPLVHKICWDFSQIIVSVFRFLHSIPFYPFQDLLVLPPLCLPLRHGRVGPRLRPHGTGPSAATGSLHTAAAGGCLLPCLGWGARGLGAAQGRCAVVLIIRCKVPIRCDVLHSGEFGEVGHLSGGVILCNPALELKTHTLQIGTVLAIFIHTFLYYNLCLYK